MWWLLLLDAGVIVGLLFAKAGLLYGLAYVLSGRKADLKFRRCLWIALFVDLLFAVLVTEPHWMALAKVCLTIALICALVCHKLFWIGLGQSVKVGLVFCVAAVGLAEGATAGLEQVLPARPTVRRATLAVMDRHLRAVTGDTELPACSTLGQGLGRLLSYVLENGAGGLLTPVQSGLDTAQKVRDLQAQSEQRLALIHAIADAGLEADEQRVAEASMELQQLPVATEPVAAAGRQTGPLPPAVQPEGAAPLPARAVKQQPSPAPAPAVSLIAMVRESLSGAGTAGDAAATPKSRAEPPPPDRVAADRPDRTPEPPEIKLAVETNVVGSVGLSTLMMPEGCGADSAAVPAGERQRWLAALGMLKLTGAVSSGGGKGVASVGGRLLNPGQTVAVELDGKSYEFVLLAVERGGRCRWGPYFGKAGAAEENTGTDFVGF